MTLATPKAIDSGSSLVKSGTANKSHEADLFDCFFPFMPKRLQRSQSHDPSAVRVFEEVGADQVGWCSVPGPE